MVSACLLKLRSAICHLRPLSAAVQVIRMRFKLLLSMCNMTFKQSVCFATPDVLCVAAQLGAQAIEEDLLQQILSSRPLLFLSRTTEKTR